MQQDSFNPIDYCFNWTNDNWYDWDREAAFKAAKAARDERYKELKAKGFRPKRWVNRNQIITRGGIGTGKPEISLVVNVFYVDYYVD